MTKVTTMSVLRKSGFIASYAMLLSLGIGASAPAQAQQAGEAVAATVNDAMISTFDVRQRMRLMILTSGGRIPESAFAQLQQQALRDLIEERLKLQEAERLEFSVEQDAIEADFAQIAASVKMTPVQLSQQLLQQGIAPETLKNQIRSRLVWQQLVAARYSRRVRVTDDEVERMRADLREDLQGEQYLMAEICLPIEDPDKSAEIYDAGIQMIGQMRQGVPFEALARQFSACPSSAGGGDLGWVSPNDMPEELSTVVKTLEPGSVSVPTPHDGMMHIMAVRQKRDAAQGGTASYQLAYAGAPLYVGEATAREAFSKLNQTKACEGQELSVDLGPDIGVTVLPPLPTEAMRAEFRAPVAALERGEISDLIVTGNAYHAVMLCEKDEGIGLPPRNAIEDKLFAEELSLISRRYLRDLERDSSVDIKVSTGSAAEGSNG